MNVALRHRPTLPATNRELGVILWLFLMVSNPVEFVPSAAFPYVSDVLVVLWPFASSIVAPVLKE